VPRGSLRRKHTLHDSHAHLVIESDFGALPEMVPKSVARMFMTLMMFSGGICTANGLLAVVPAAGEDNATRRHGTQVRACASSAGTLLAFVQHWHGSLSDPASAGTMTLQDDVTLAQTTSSPNFMLPDTAVASLDSQCATGITTTLISDCPSDSYRDDWAVYAFPVSCGSTSSYTLLSGNTVVLTEGCSNLYPATVSGSVACPPSLGTPMAVGDPHLQNVHGERFDLMKPGKHVLVNIPRGAGAEKSLLRVQADARMLGGQCADMYFQEVNVTGSWAEAKQVGGYHYSVSQRDVETPEWVVFGKVGLKVVNGRTDAGLLYLNVYVKHLGRAGYAVGGLLGEDDHADVVTPPEACVKRMTLIGGVEGGRSAPSVLSVAVASLA